MQSAIRSDAGVHGVFGGNPRQPRDDERVELLLQDLIKQGMMTKLRAGTRSTVLPLFTCLMTPWVEEPAAGKRTCKDKHKSAREQAKQGHDLKHRVSVPLRDRERNLFRAYDAPHEISNKSALP